jgi:hypothetical protein
MGRAEERRRVRNSFQFDIAHGVELEGVAPGRVGDGLTREDLARFRHVGDPGCEVHRLPEDVEVPLDHRAGVDPGVRRDRLCLHRPDEVERGVHARRGVRYSQQRSITKELHESAAVAGRGLIGPALQRPRPP